MSLLRTASHVAVASAVNGRVRQRQMRRMAGAGAPPAPAAPLAPAAPPAAPEAPPPAAPVATATTDPAERLALLRQLGELRDAGVLTADEFETQKARLLA